VRDIAPDVPIIARVNRAEEVPRIRATGADFALSIGQVAGQLLGRQLFGEEFVALEPRMRLVKVSAAGLGGLDPASARIRERTGCSIVVIERGGDLLVDLDRDFEIHPEDSIYLDQAIVIEEDGKTSVYRNWFQDYTLEAITRELENGGFTIQSVWSDLTGLPFSKDSEWIGIVVKKK